MADTKTLFSPAGEKYETGSRAEVTRLIAAGYSEKKPTPTQIAAETGKKP
jgi:hypothetical protein